MHVKKVHIIFKTHLDIGYTGPADEVLKTYFEEFIPAAINTSDQFRTLSETDRYVWTCGSWLIYEYLERASKPQRTRLENAINLGDVCWHALPFTMHSELSDGPLFRDAMAYSQRLDTRFGKKTLSAKMTDVPGHTIGIVPILAKAGVRFLHIGVNEVSCPPDVPPIFKWRHQDGSEIIVMYHKFYGDLMVVPGMDEAIYFAMTLDNIGPHSYQEACDIFSKTRQQFPGANVIASNMNAFANKLIKSQIKLPVVTKEIGDSWIHGIGSDPKLVSWFRSLSRCKDTVTPTNSPQANQLEKFIRTLLLIPEHTWGADEKVLLADHTNYSNKQFHRVKKTRKYRLFEKSWQQKRTIVKTAMSTLTDYDLSSKFKHALKDCAAKYPRIAGQSRLTKPTASIRFGRFELGLQNEPAAICRLTDTVTGRDWASRTNPLAMFRYETFCQADYDCFMAQYLTTKNKKAIWAIEDFSKIGIDSITKRHLYFYPRINDVFVKKTTSQSTVLMHMKMPKDGIRLYGCPPECFLEIAAQDNDPCLNIIFQWFRKTACRLPEALWLSFNPVVNDANAWDISKMGSIISPLNVVENGNRHLHCVENVRYKNSDGFFQIENLDSPLVAPGKPSLLNFTNDQPDMRDGFHFNLFNNVWGTNFRMWYDEDAKFRFKLQLR